MEERQKSWVENALPNVTVVRAAISRLDSVEHELYTTNEKCYQYEKLCIATGASPKLIAKDNPSVLGIRDTETVEVFQKKLSRARRIVVVGNGGIATELVHEIEGCQVIWAIKHDSINNTFFDAGAAEFMLGNVNAAKCVDDPRTPLKRKKYTIETPSEEKGDFLHESGTALGPDWHSGVEVKGAKQSIGHDVHIEYLCEVDSVLKQQELQTSDNITRLHDEGADVMWPTYVLLSNGKCYGCDFVISATGVIPNTAPFLTGNSFSVAENGGLLVDEHLQTSVTDVYAAGDVCTVNWPPAKHWFQMRLWSQARQMGHYAAKCILADFQHVAIEKDFCFEIFAHITKFFSFKCVLLGRYNAQGLDVKDFEVLLRVTKGKEYVKVVLKDGKMIGAILIGETDLEETFENLIINELDLTQFGENLLDPNVDIEDYFD